MAKDSLRSYRRKVAAVEAKLLQARDAMREAAKRAGIDTAGLFSETGYISRGTGERWVREAHMKGFRSALEGNRVLFEAGLLHYGEINTYSAEMAADQMLADLIINAGKKARGERK